MSQVSFISFTSFTRRVRTAMLVVASLSAGVTSLIATAAAPQIKIQAPGYFRMMLGDFEVTAISDGTIALPMSKLLTNIKPADTEKAFARFHLKEPFETSVNAYLINTGSKLVLLDTGAGVLFGPTLGRLAANLKASGYQPEQVDEIYITHMHGDHIGGLVSNGQIVFPNAVVRADQHEIDFWLSQANLDAAQAADKGGFQGAMSMLNPYVKAGKLKAFDGDTELTSGIRAKISRGHTPGHSYYVVESKGQKLVIWGDMMHAAAVQFANPAVSIKFDSDTKASAVQRKIAYAEAAKEGYLVALTHVSFPGIGHVRANGKAYEWLPINYTNLP